MKTIAIEDLATVFASELIHYLICYPDITYKTFIKMNYARRKKLVEKVLDKMLPNGNLLH